MRSSTAAQKSFFRKDLINVAKPCTRRLPESMKGVGFGTVFTSHMLEVDWTAEGGWEKPTITNFQPFHVSPACTGIQYGLQCFEGLKAYRDKETNTARMFRPDRNAHRLNNSCKRLTLPSFDENEFIECLSELVRLEKDWIPTDDNHSLYIRPTVISTTASLDIAPATAAKMFIITSPVGPYYSTGFKPVKLLVNPKAHRAWPGGTGASKIGPNYAGPIPHQIAAAKLGYGQVLWLGPQNVVDEVGAMNFMMLWKNKDGVRELITAPLDGTILPGITRDSILTLAREGYSNEFKVSERRFTIDDVVEALKDGRVEEMFGCGTAAIITSVNGLKFGEKEYAVPCPEDENKSLAKRLMKTIVGIQTGKIPSAWSVVV
jgi:branched-chain amino acid aminotransferase